MTFPANADALLRQMQTMRPADLSMLEAGLKAPDSEIVTVAGSANDTLWSHMADLGWMIRRPGLPQVGGFQNKSYSIAPAGIQPIRDLLASLPERRRKQYEKMKAIFDDFCVGFARQLTERVRAADGGSADIVILSALTLAQIIKLNSNQGEYSHAAQTIHKIVEGELSKSSAGPKPD